jgi:hypothetical protein
LELWWQYSGLHCDCLTDLQVQTAICAKEIEDALSIASMHGFDGFGKRRMSPKVDLVVTSYQDAVVKGSDAAN